MATIEEIQTAITAAKAQRANVALGTAVVEFWRDGRRLTMKVASMSELNAYIAQLERDLVAAQIEAGQTPTRTRRAIGIVYR